MVSLHLSAVSYRRLACAIVARAVRDAQAGNGSSAEARRWLVADPLAGFLFDSLGYDRQRVRRWVLELEPLEQPALL
jgi:hypothetical protein